MQFILYASLSSCIDNKNRATRFINTMTQDISFACRNPHTEKASFHFDTTPNLSRAMLVLSAMFIVRI